MKDESVNIVVDKGTLDALLPVNAEEAVEKVVTQMFGEIERILAPVTYSYHSRDNPIILAWSLHCCHAGPRSHCSQIPRDLSKFEQFLDPHPQDRFGQILRYAYILVCRHEAESPVANSAGKSYFPLVYSLFSQFK